MTLTPSLGTTQRPPRVAIPRLTHKTVTAGATVAALGVVFGDIGTSPLYALQAVFTLDHGALQSTPAAVYGVVSLVFWSITLVVSLKYVLLVLRADNHGEGGVMALAALARRVLTQGAARNGAIVMTVGVFGAALFYGDSAITPAISVLSAVAGLRVAAPSLSHAVIPTAAVILAILFGVQRWGTGRIGKMFGPVMLLWFLVLAVTGLRQVVAHPAIVRGLSPAYGAQFFAAHPATAFLAMGAVVLAVTGAEALFADLGHFGRRPIRRAWFAVVFPSLTLNYLAQGSLILRDPASKANPFFLLVPHWGQLPLVALAALATVIASQGVISGSFSVAQQATRLGFLPYLRSRHTSSQNPGRVYIGAVNWTLFAAVLAVTVGFGSATRLTTAYGVAVTGTFLITTSLFLIVASTVWHWASWKLLAVGFGIGGVELTFFVANLTKIVHGGWLPLLLAVALFTVMVTWQRARQLVAVRRKAMEGDLHEFVSGLAEHRELTRVPGTAVYPHSADDTVPLALRLNVERNHVIHTRVAIISAHTTAVAHLPWPKRVRLESLTKTACEVVHLAADFGFQDVADIPETVQHANAKFLNNTLDVDAATYFLSRITLHRSTKHGISTWQKRLFMLMAHNSASQADSFCLPEARTVIMGAQLDL